jgi:hypothetical protein
MRIKMGTTEIAEEIESLPVEAQKEVIDFVAFLKTRYPAWRTIRKNRQTKLPDEPFIGMWRGREGMRNSVAWVKSLRQCEWGHRL